MDSRAQTASRSYDVRRQENAVDTSDRLTLSISTASGLATGVGPAMINDYGANVLTQYARPATRRWIDTSMSQPRYTMQPEDGIITERWYRRRLAKQTSHCNYRAPLLRRLEGDTLQSPRQHTVEVWVSLSVGQRVSDLVWFCARFTWRMKTSITIGRSRL